MKVAWMFPGQGSQELGMGGELLDTDEMRSLLASAQAITGRPITDIIKHGPKAQLDQTPNTQVAILVVSLGMLALYAKQRGAEIPDFVVGHSAGEVTALVATGSLTQDEAIAFIYERGLAMEEAGELNPGGMAAMLGIDDEQAETLITKNGAYVANYNIPNRQIVASGSVPSIQKASDAALEAGARVVRLDISIAAHSPLMQSAAERVKEAIAAVDVQNADVPVVSNATGTIIHKAADIKQHLPEQLTQPVRWSSGIDHLRTQGVGEFVEIGPRDVLANMVRRQLKGEADVIVRRAEDELTIKNPLQP